MEKNIKFYQIIAPVILSIMYTATIFGPENDALPYIPEVVWNLIDEFRGKDGAYKEVRCVKSQLDGGKKRLKLICGATAGLFFTAVLVQRLLRIAPKKSVLLLSLFSAFLVSITGVLITEVNNYMMKDYPYLRIGSVERVEILDNPEGVIAMGERGTNMVYFLLLSNMRHYFMPTPIPSPLFSSEHPKIVKRDELAYVLTDDGKIVTIPADDGRECDPLRDLPMPVKVTAFDVSKDKETMVIIGEDNRLRKFKLEKSEGMHKLMNIDKLMDVD